MRLHYNVDNSYLFLNEKEIFKFKVDNKNANFSTQFCLGSISNGFSSTESREVSLNGIVYDFSVDYNSIDIPCMVRPTFIDMNPVELKYYLFMISLSKCSGSCNALSCKACVPKETKPVYVKAFDMITNKNEAKVMTKHIFCDCKCKFNSKTCNTKQKWSDKTCKYECKNYKCEKDYN